MRWLALAAVALLIVPATSGGWNQHGGDGGRSNVVPAQPIAHDLVSHGNLLIDGASFASQLNNMPLFIVVDDSIVAGVDIPRPASDAALPFCGILRTNAQMPEAAEPIEFDCPAGSLRIWADTGDSLLACQNSMDASEVAMVLDRRTFEVLERIGSDSVTPGPGTSLTPGQFWNCPGSAYDEERRIAYISLDGPRTNRIIAYDVENREKIWEREPGALDEANYRFLPVDDPPSPVHTFSITVTAGGLLIQSDIQENRYVRWMDEDGNLLRVTLSSEDLTEQSARAVANRLSQTAASDGQTATFLLDSRIYIVDILAGTEIQRLVPYETIQTSSWLAGPATLGPLSLVPLETSAVLYRSAGTMQEVQTGDRTIVWSGLSKDFVGWLLVIPPSSLSEAGVRPASLLRVDLVNGHIIQDLPLTIQRNAATLAPPYTVAGDTKGLTIVAADGTWNRVESSSTSPTTSISSLNPSPREQISVENQADDTVRTIIAWGDGTVSSFGPNETMSYVYGQEGVFLVRATVVFNDLTTQTAVFTLNVGAEPLNWLQARFAAGEQDTTWGVIGTFFVLIGALTALVNRRLGRSRISKGLRELATIRDGGGGLSAIKQLQGWHRKQEERMLGGRLTEDQFRVLENRGSRLMRGLVNTALESVSGTFPRLVTQRLEAAYADGFVDSAEIDAIRSAAERARLPAAKKRVLSDLLDAWN